ncbi:CRISPR-associated endonuclease Cas2 [Thermostichus sp. MS-CIW-38]
MQLYVITYDIPDNKRRKKVSDLLEGYGRRVQYSVFECRLEQHQYQDLIILGKAIGLWFRWGIPTSRCRQIPKIPATRYGKNLSKL